MSVLFSLPSGMRLMRIEPSDVNVPMQLVVKTVSRSAQCPVCQHVSRRVHSHYWRSLADLPSHGSAVRLRVQARRFFCSNRRCPRHIFAERLTPLATAHAQRTQRLKQAQTRLGQAMGSRPGVRLGQHLAMPTSATTLLRLERNAPLPVRATPRVLGVDDWAFRKGHNYGTILFDLERRWVVDLLADRKPETLAAWLTEHPGVEIVSRDRAEAYASAIRQGAPKAQQVTDRWHLVKNLGQALERVLEEKRALLHQATQPPPDPHKAIAQTSSCASPAAPEENAPNLSRQQERLAQQKQDRRHDRLQRYQQVRALFAKGWNICSIAEHMNLSRKTVRRFATASTFPERHERMMRPCQIDAFAVYLQQRWQSGCHNGAQLYEEIRQRGYSGGHTMLQDFLAKLRQQPSDQPPAPREKVSPRQVAMWILRRDKDRTPRQQALLDNLAQLWEPFQIARTLAQRFLEMVRQCPRTDQAATFRQWLIDTLASGVSALRNFGASLQQDQAAVEAGLSLRWSNGPVEGSNNRLKFLKRRGYGRAHFDLLRCRVLQTT